MNTPHPAPGAEGAHPASDRLLFFFSGFDPKGPPFYHRLVREAAQARQAQAQAQTDADAQADAELTAVADADAVPSSPSPSISVGARHRLGRWASAWNVHWRGESWPDEAPHDPAGSGSAPPRACGEVLTQHHFMRWDDIVRRFWFRSAAQLFRDYWGIYVGGALDGGLRGVCRGSLTVWLMALFPLFVAVMSLGLAGLACWSVGVAARVHPAMNAAVTLIGALLVWRRIALRLDCEWLLRLYAFTREHSQGQQAQLDRRLDDMAQQLCERVAWRLGQGDPAVRPLREVTIVGYSTGAIIATAVLARALPRLQALLDTAGDGAGAGPASMAGSSGSRPVLSLLTLGHCVPIASGLPRAHRVRQELQSLVRAPGLVWRDFTAPADWAGFHHRAPWADVQAPPEADLRMRSPRFHAQVQPATWAHLRRRRREMHLQYLRRGDALVGAHDYDYLRLTSGPLPLHRATAPPIPASPASRP